MTDPDWEKAVQEHYGQSIEELSAEAERGYDTSQMRARHISRGMSADRRLGAVERFEVIDHRMETVAAEQPARPIVAYGARIMLSFQDGGKTFKIFLSDE